MINTTQRNQNLRACLDLKVVGSKTVNLLNATITVMLFKNTLCSLALCFQVSLCPLTTITLSKKAGWRVGVDERHLCFMKIFQNNLQQDRSH